MSEICLEIPDSLWLQSNGTQPHWKTRGDMVKGLQLMAINAAREAKTRRYTHARVTAFIQYRTNGRADPNNAHPTTKALIDGLVHAGVFPDDDDTHVLGPDHRREKGRAPKGTHRVRLVITDQEVTF